MRFLLWFITPGIQVVAFQDFCHEEPLNWVSYSGRNTNPTRSSAGKLTVPRRSLTNCVTTPLPEGRGFSRLPPASIGRRFPLGQDTLRQSQMLTHRSRLISTP